MQIQSTSPLNGKKLKSLKVSLSQEIEDIIESASNFESKFAKYSLENKLELMYSLKAQIRKNKSKILEQINLEIGKPLSDAEYEVEDTLMGIDQYILHAKSFYSNKIKKKELFEKTDFYFKHKPLGTTGIVMPWNFPFWMPMGFIVPALLAGNPTIFKPSEKALLVGELIQDLVLKAGYPKQALQRVIGGPVEGNQIVRDNRVKNICFVGSTDVGISIGESVIRKNQNYLKLEMGGNSAAIVMNDANIDNAIEAILWNGTYYAGQVCTGVKRVLVHKHIYKEFTKKLIARVKQINSPEFLVKSVGAIIDEGSIKVLEYKLKEAIKNGNKVLAGGKRVAKEDLPNAYKNGCFFYASIVEISNTDIALINDETFAPVLPLIQFSSKEEAVQLSNQTKYKLSANVFTNNEKIQNYFLDNLDAGMIFVNDSELAYPGGNFWKGKGQSYFSNTVDDRFESMFEKIVVWHKTDPSLKREYWYK